jgi:hypothetical protein
MTTADEHFGGDVELTLAQPETDFEWWEDRRVHNIHPDQAGRAVYVPSLASGHVPVGRFLFILRNGGAWTFALGDRNGQSISKSVAIGGVALCHTYMDGTDQKWFVDTRAGA